MITLRQILSYGSVIALKSGPPDNMSDAMEYLKQGTETDREDSQAIIDAIALMEVVIVATPNDGEAIVDHLNWFLERHKDIQKGTDDGCS